MPQSNVIFFYLFAAFFVFITMRGELPKYMGFLLSSPIKSVTINGSSTDTASSASSVVKTAASFIAQNPEVLAF